jgi:hypothetical protein
MVEKKTWEEFRAAGLLWWINMIMHTFGWALVVDIEDDGSISNAYPARVAYRGFDVPTNTEGYIKVSQFLSGESNVLLDEAKS